MPAKKTTKQPEAPKIKNGFYLHVDGVKYGPFLDAHKPQFADLEHRKGVFFEPVRLKHGWKLPPEKPKTAKPDKSLPLLEGVGFTPTPRIKGVWD